MLSWCYMASNTGMKPFPEISFDEIFKTTNDLHSLTALIRLSTPSSPIWFLAKFKTAILSVSKKLPIAPANTGPNCRSLKLAFRFMHRFWIWSLNLINYAGYIFILRSSHLLWNNLPISCSLKICSLEPIYSALSILTVLPHLCRDLVKRWDTVPILVAAISLRFWKARVSPRVEIAGPAALLFTEAKSSILWTPSIFDVGFLCFNWTKADWGLFRGANLWLWISFSTSWCKLA